MSDVDPFDEGVPRGRYGRPLIIPTGRGGKPNAKAALVEYDRASTVADALDTGGGLATWQTRHAVIGVANNTDLAALAAALGQNLNTFTDEDKRNLDAVIERAHDRSGGNEKADYGTAIHSLTEPDNDGTIVVASMAGDVDSYLVTIGEAGIEVDATEVFVVNDTLKAAGTFDHVYRFTRDLEVKINGQVVTLPAGTKLIGDKKTGSLHFDAHAIQLAIYARGAGYDHRTGKRAALDVSPQWGVIAHIAREGAKTTLYLVDLAEGWIGAKLAVQVRAYTLGSRKRLSAAFATCEAPAVQCAEPSPTDTVPHSADPFATGPRVEVVEEPNTGDIGVIVDDVLVEVNGEPVDEPGIPDALVALHRAGLAPIDAVLHQISTAPDDAACHALWTKCKRDGIDWTPGHTEAVKARLAELNAAA